MRHIITAIVIFAISISCAKADDIPISFERLPQAAQKLINTYYPGEEVSFVIQDDDRIRPDFDVRLANGVEIHFDYEGNMEKISARKSGVPDGLVADQISGYVDSYYPDAKIVEYEIDRRTIEVTLSNNLEITFNRNYKVIETDN